MINLERMALSMKENLMLPVYDPGLLLPVQKETPIRDIQQHLLRAISELASAASTKLVAKDLGLEIEGWTDAQWNKVIDLFQPNQELLKQQHPIVSPFKLMESRVKGSLNKSILLVLPSAGTYPHFLPNLQRLCEVLDSTSQVAKLAVVLDGEQAMKKKDEVISVIDEHDISYNVLGNDRSVGYKGSILQALDCVQTSKYCYIGFIDDDAFITQDDHYNKMIKALEDPSVFAVSGLAVDTFRPGSRIHSFFNIPNSYSFFIEAQNRGYDLTKPHIHGGGGACLARADDFREALNISTENELLLGPTISALGRSYGKMTPAMHDSLVLHPTKHTLYNWLGTIHNYYETWKALPTRLIYSTEPYRNDYLPKEQGVFEDILPPENFEAYGMLRNFRLSFKNNDKRV